MLNAEWEESCCSTRHQQHQQNNHEFNSTPLNSFVLWFVGWLPPPGRQRPIRSLHQQTPFHSVCFFISLNSLGAAGRKNSIKLISLILFHSLLSALPAVHSPPTAQINQFHPNKFSFIDLLLSTGQPMYDNTVIILFFSSIPFNNE